MKLALHSFAFATLISFAVPLAATVKEVSSLKDFNKILADNPNKLIVVDFYAPWCGPCKGIAPKFEKLSNQDTSVIFIKVNVDVINPHNVVSMPTFEIIINNKVVEVIKVPDIDRVKKAIQKHKKEISANKCEGCENAH